MKASSIVLSALIFASYAHAQQRWTKTYGGVDKDECRSVRQTLDGGYISAGYTASLGAGGNDVYLIKTSASGDTQWTRTYGGTGSDYGNWVSRTNPDGYIIIGSTTSFGAGGNDVYLIKTNTSGDTLWTRTYGGASDDYGYSAWETFDGGYILAGSSLVDSLGDIWLIKTNSSGDTLWSRKYAGANEHMSYLAEQMPGGGGYIISGSTNSRGAGSYDIYLIKTDSLGDTLWTRAYGGASYDEGWAGQTAEGGYIICGSTMSYGAGGTDIWLIKTNASGDTLWTRTYGGASDDYGYSAQQVWDGSHAGYVIAGYTESFGAGGNDVYLVRTDLAGDTLWTRTYGGASDDYGYDVQQTSDYGYIVTGYTTSFGTGSNDVYLIKTDANGSVGVEAPRSDRQVVAGRLKATPNPFTSFATIPGHEAERFDVYDISGKMVGIFRGDRVGEGLSPAVYFIRLDDRHGGATGIVKVR